MDSVKNVADTVNSTRQLQEQNKLRKIKKEQFLIRGNRNYIFENLNEDEQQEYVFLFADKENLTSEESKKFWLLFNKFGRLQVKQDYYDFSEIVFPYIGQFQKDFYSAFHDKKNKQYIDFSGCTFDDNVHLSSMTFKLAVIFQGAEFKKDLDFCCVTFQQRADFSQVSFQDNAFFNECTFMDHVSFENSEAKGIFDFSDTAFSSLSLDKSTFPYASYLRLLSYNKSSSHIKKDALSTNNLNITETARIIKAHFEKEKNMLEANKYYAFEQELHLGELIENGFWSNKGDIFTIWLHKLISNSSTSWLKVLFWIVLFGLVTLFFHDGLPTTKETILNIPNRAVELINPMNIFKKDYNLYKDHEFWAIIVRIITLYLFYQFAMAFRQKTRRK